MGCDLSKPEDLPVSGGKPSSTSKPIKGIGHTERLMSAQLKQARANVSSGGPNTVSLEADEEITKEMPKLDGEGKLMPEEVVRRTSSSLNVSRVKIGDKEKGGKTCEIQYAYRSQRGYYPDDPTKENQDKYGITLNFAGENGDALFSVYDGHGEHGHSCAAWAKKQLPQVLGKYIRQKRVQRYQQQLKAEGKPTKGAWNPKQWPMLDKADYEECCHKAFVETNTLMHKDEKVEDKLSGTTAATVCFHGGRMTVCNVGDSRVLLGHRAPSYPSAGDATAEEEKCDVETEIRMSDDEQPKHGEILAIPLSRDQTPYRKDERERVRNSGAEVKTMDQMEKREPMHDNWGDMVLGERVDIQGDPPRIWVSGRDYPGTAFTRSIGDRLADDIGVIAEPEMITKDLTVNDEFLVIATDGIFEFLTNQQVMNICAASFNPVQACEMLCKAAYDQWLVYENRTDDITVIVCFLKSSYQPTPDKEGETTESLVTSPL